MGLGAVATSALIGAAIGGGEALLTHGNVLEGAAIGGAGGALTSGLSGPLAGVTGLTVPQAGGLIGAGVGGIGSAITGGNPLLGALTGGASGYIGQGGLGSLTGDGSGVDPFSGGQVLGDSNVPTASGGISFNPDTGQVTLPTTAGPQATSSNAITGGGASAGIPSVGGGGGGGGGISGTALALGALAAAGSLFNKPTQAAYGNTPGPAQVAANTGPYYNTNLNTTAPGRTAVNPYSNGVPAQTTAGYGTYGGPEQTYFTGNSLLNYGFAKGGALSRIPERDFRTGSGAGRVRGPGTETSDSIPARLSDGEYVLDSTDVKKIGHGSTARGTKALDRARPQLARGRGALSQLVAA